MGLNFRKSIKIGPARINLSKSGVGYSVGTKGLRFTKKAGGGTRTTVGIPGTGISYTKDGRSKKKSVSTSHTQNAGKSVTETTPRTTEPLKKSWFSAILMAIIGFLFVGIVSLVVIFIVGLIVSIFVTIPGWLTYTLLFGLPLALAFLAAFIAFRELMPEKKPSDVCDALEESADELLTESVIEENHTEKEVSPRQESEVRTYRVAGIEYYLDNLLSMMQPNYLYAYKKQELIDICHTSEPIYKQTVPTDQLELVPEPTNPHDPNAIMVQLGGKLVGYIPAKDCEHVLELLRSDRILSLTCQVEGGKYKMVNEDYDCMKDKSTYKMETGEDPYGITIYIREKL